MYVAHFLICKIFDLTKEIPKILNKASKIYAQREKERDRDRKRDSFDR